MRDNHDGYPELLDAYERDGLYFGALTVAIKALTLKFRLLSIHFTSEAFVWNRKMSVMAYFNS